MADAQKDTQDATPAKTEEPKVVVSQEAPADVSAEVPAKEATVVVSAEPAEPVGTLSGVVDGVVEKTDESLPEPIRDRIDHAEKVVHEYDADGNEIGWHKEAVEG